jgi:hypothetical protein
MSELVELFTGRGASLLRAALEPALLERARAALLAQPLHRYELRDRGSYGFRDDLDLAEHAELLAALRARAAAATGRTPARVAARLLELVAGDYLLAHHDRPHVAPSLELILDLSPAAVPGAEVHYRRGGRGFWVMPSLPGGLSIVECAPGVTCHHTYVSKLHTSARVLRMVIRLDDGA